MCTGFNSETCMVLYGNEYLKTKELCFVFSVQKANLALSFEQVKLAKPMCIELNSENYDKKWN